MVADFLSRAWHDFKAMGLAEWLAVATGVVYVFGIVWRRRFGWIFGGISSFILAVLAWRGRLPMQALLQFSYVVAAVYGWWQWSGTVAQPRITVWHWRGHALTMVGCLLVSFGLAPLLRGESAFPFVDSLVACVALAATWMLARVYIENWLYWIAVDAVSIHLFFAQRLTGVAVLYVVYFSMAVFGFFSWWKQYRGQPRAP